MGRFRQRKVAEAVAQTAGRNTVQAIVLAGAREAVRLVPRDTGLLANSIQSEVKVRGTRVYGTIGSNVEHAAPVEFGTHAAGEPDAPGKVSSAPGGMPARPYLRPGLRAGVTYARRKGLIR